MPHERQRKVDSWGRQLRKLGVGARNALQVSRELRAETPYRAPFDVIHEDRAYRLRRYTPDASSTLRYEPILLVPPLMVTAEVYDIAPDLSAVTFLQSHGLDVWMVDFGAPETEVGGLERTLDDHIRAVGDGIDRIVKATGHRVHLAGYSQGGMFAYQAAAYRRSEGIRSIITFGSPVDIRATVPPIFDDELLDRAVRAIRNTMELPLQHLEQLPGFITSKAFKLLSIRKELTQFLEFFRLLDDREALRRRESRRRFLGGEGFVAWPGPALRKFIDEFIVNNRMTSGGFVIHGRTVSLADITVPILYYLGTRDELAKPAAVRGIHAAAPRAERYELLMKAGHFGLVVGSSAMSITWPTVVEWIRWQSNEGPMPARLAPNPAGPVAHADDEIDAAPLEDIRLNLKLFYDAAADAIDSLWNGVGELSRDVTVAVDALQYQLPRFQQLRRLDDDARWSVGRTLAEQAGQIPNQTFFLHRGRAFSYRDADRRVSYVVNGLWACGVRPGARVGIFMDNRPSYLTMVAAVSRIGAVSVLMGPNMSRLTLREAMSLGKVEIVVADPERGQDAREAFGGPVLVLGGGAGARTLANDIIDMEAIDPDSVELPDSFEPNPGRAADLAMVIFGSDGEGRPQAIPVTNRRWALGAVGTAAATTLTTADTVYCCLPLYHASGMLVAVSGALVGGARLALAERFDTTGYWEEVRRYGATVAFYTGGMCRMLLSQPVDPLEKNHSLRLFAGTGLSPEVWTRLQRRFGPVDVIEYYTAAERDAVLVNLAGTPPGSVGRPLKNSPSVELVEYDILANQVVRNAEERLQRVRTGSTGMLVVRLGRKAAAAARDAADPRVVSGAFEDGDAWAVTGDLLQRDANGSFWWVDRATDIYRFASHHVSPGETERVLEQAPGVQEAVLLRWELASGLQATEAILVLDAAVPPTRSELHDAIVRIARLEQRPDFVRVVSEIPRTDTWKPNRAALLNSLHPPISRGWDGFWWDEERSELRRVDGRSHSRVHRQLGLRYA